MASTLSSDALIRMEAEYAAHNYHPLPMVFQKAQGVYVWDPEGNKYIDFLSAYSAVNQGHSHPKIIKALTDQASTLCLSSRAFYNNMLPQYAKFITEYFGFDMVLPTNTGAEAVETAIKMSRKWGYSKKGIPQDEAIVLACEGNFHGRTIGVVSMSTDPEARKQFGPFVPLVTSKCPKTGKPIRYNNIQDIEDVFSVHGDKMAAFLVEPIQGEAGIIVPDDAFLLRAYELCKKHNVLFIADEIQTGIGRTGKLLAIDHVGIKPDIVTLGKALSGGVYPVSAVLARKDIMLCIEPGSHGSTFGGNPIACAVAMAALNVVKEENLVQQSEERGKLLRQLLSGIKHPIIKQVRGRGLLNAVEIDGQLLPGKGAWHLCLLMKKNGLLAKPTHDTIIRLAPPLCITEEQVREAVEIFKRSIEELETVDVKSIPGMEYEH
ncbi:pyridoxal phosphate-dependent transferase [Syncephalis pseudoplumigaleata]|uniref:Ornithine aminotransferase n=1 Tax=Syncephalis pseudoplumigaleata TaxID=1712513 RepID=A0A4P9Z6N9_9FUNG|nr:pyridoxal phosphate-dependent transferase [Syncephalis pseudoplumigaleata]|eukprot:RKP27340.1 pyridoxal phosphate-dependent transferase [Syncephalis pseudoplumigaleata]